MRLENAEIGQWEMKLDSDLTAKVELTIRADIVSIPDKPSNTFVSPIVRCDFENYISKYEFGDGLVGGEKTKSELFDELCKVKKELSDAKSEKASLEMKVKVLELLFGSEQRISKKLRENVNSLCDGQVELQNDLRKSEIERAKLEKDLMSVADILQVGGLCSVNDILDKAHYWVHERSIDDEELKMILRMDLDAGREETLDRIEEVVKEVSEREEAHAALMNVYNACLPAKMNLADDATATDISKEIVRVITNKEKLRNMDAVILGDFLSFRDKVKKMVGCESNECSEILDVLKRHLEDKKEVESKRQDAIRDAAKKAGSLGNGVYLDGLTVEQNLRAENVRLKAEREKYKARIKDLEESLDCIYNEASAALGYE